MAVVVAVAMASSVVLLSATPRPTGFGQSPIVLTSLARANASVLVNLTQADIDGHPLIGMALDAMASPGAYANASRDGASVVFWVNETGKVVVRQFFFERRTADHGAGAGPDYLYQVHFCGTFRSRPACGDSEWYFAMSP